MAVRLVWSSSPLRSGELFRLASSSHHVHGAGASRAVIKCGLVGIKQYSCQIHADLCRCTFEHSRIFAIFGVRVLECVILHTDDRTHVSCILFRLGAVRSFVCLSDSCARPSVCSMYGQCVRYYCSCVELATRSVEAVGTHRGLRTCNSLRPAVGGHTSTCIKPSK